MLTLIRRFVLMSLGSWFLAQMVRRYPRLSIVQRALGIRPLLAPSRSPSRRTVG